MKIGSDNYKDGKCIVKLTKDKENLKRPFKPEPCLDCAELKKKVKKLERLVNDLLLQSKAVVVPSKPNNDPDIREIDLDLGEPLLSATARRYGEG